MKDPHDSEPAPMDEQAAALRYAETRIREVAAKPRATLLDLSNLGLTTLPESLGQLTQLRHLRLFDNALTTLPEWIGQLTQLQRLNLTRNRLTSLPESLRRLKMLEELYLHNNDALGLPREVLGPTRRQVYYHGASPGAPAAILDYYFRIRRGSRPLNEVKLILVGRGGVGKTCLIKRMMQDTFDAHEPETTGIEIQPWLVTLPDDDKVRLHVWDFGGQEILHATHQLFLTERTLYLLVLSGREGNPTQDAEYWLQLIKSFGSNSRVIVALNKSAQHPFDVNRGRLLEKYSFIAEFVRTDCQDGTGIHDLKRAIFSQTGVMEHRKVDFPAEWFEIKERLATMEESFITWDRYQDICLRLGEKDAEAQRKLAGFIHILGIALNYRDDPRLRETHVLNPRWVTEGIYSLLRAGQRDQREGILTLQDLGVILDVNRYPYACHAFLLHLMEKFQLCF